MTAKKSAEPDVLDALETEIALVRDDSSLIEKFAQGVKVFFGTARRLEAVASATLAKAEHLRAPTSMVEDEHLQFFIRAANADKKTVLEHWAIAAKVHAFHRRLVAHRTRPEEALERAVSLATRHHNTWVQAERLRVAQENEARRLQEEARARRVREAELADLERQALDAEAASPELSKREVVFVDYITGPYRDPQRAAQQAGYKDAFQAAARLLASDKIRRAIAAKETANAIRDQKAAVQSQPLEVESAPRAEARISTASGGHSRTTWSAELVDERALITAILYARPGIPDDLLQINPVKLNMYARQLQGLVGRWPGVRAVEKQSFV